MSANALAIALCHSLSQLSAVLYQPYHRHQRNLQKYALLPSHHDLLLGEYQCLLLGIGVFLNIKAR